MDFRYPSIMPEEEINTETQSKNNYKELVAEKKQLAIEELKSLFPDVETTYH